MSGRTLNKDTEKAQETSCPMMCDSLSLLSNSLTDHEKVLIAQQHLFPDYAQVLAHSATVIYNHTRDPAPLIREVLANGSSDYNASHDECVESARMEKCTVWKWEMARKSSPNIGMM